MTFPWEIHIVWSEWKKITVSCIIRSVLCGNRSGALVYASGMARWPGWNTKQNVPYMHCSDVCMFAFTEGQEGNSISPPYLEFSYEFVCLRKIQPRIDWTVACLYEKEEINTHTKKKKENKKGLQPNRQINSNRRPQCQYDIVLDIVMRSRISNQ